MIVVKRLGYISKKIMAILKEEGFFYLLDQIKRRLKARKSFFSVKRSIDSLREASTIKKLEANSVLKFDSWKPLVSIIMPTKNRLKSLPEAIESVLAQSYTHWELIIVDDGSIDGTPLEIKRRYPDHRISITPSLGSGVSAARNTGLEKATGDILAYLDSDNQWVSRYLEFSLTFLKMNSLDACYSILRGFSHKIKEDGGNDFYLCDELNYEKLKMNNYIDLNVFIHKRSLYEKLGGFDTLLHRCVDWDLILKYLKNNKAGLAYFIGAYYDNTPSQDRITSNVSSAYINVVRNNYLIDWENLSKVEREKGLVSIIICVYGKKKLTLQCLESIARNDPGLRIEVLIVDNGSDPQTAKALKAFTKKYPYFKVIRNDENLNFSLGNNIGFSHSKGDIVVFLNNDTEVTPEWLRPLVTPLSDPKIQGCQPKLLYPDGTIQGVGLVFSEHSPLAYPIYLKAPGDYSPTQEPRCFKAVTGACLAMRAKDFATIKGFDPIYVNGQEDVDLCLKLGNMEPVFQYVPASLVIHHEAQTPGRGAHIEWNRKTFISRWGDKISADDKLYYSKDKTEVKNYRPDNSSWISLNCAIWTPEKEYTCKKYGSLLQSKTIAIKVPCPTPMEKESWGDYHFAVSLSHAFAKKGVKSRIDFLHDWNKASYRDINLIIRGLSRFRPRRGQLNIVWLISHPDKVSFEELEGFDVVFVASEDYGKHLADSHKLNIETLLQCTDPAKFHPKMNFHAERHQHLYVANSRKVQRDIVRMAMDENIKVDIYGQMWEGLAPSEWLKGSCIPNFLLASNYANSQVVLNDHWGDMREKGFPSNRIFDVLACGVPIVTDAVGSIPIEIQKGCFFYSENKSLKQAIKEAKSFNRKELEEISNQVRLKHSFDDRVNRILDKIVELV